MKTLGRITLVALVAALLLPGAASARKRPQQPQEGFEGWYSGLDGYREAVREHRESGRPLLVYFHAPWCGFCKRVNKKLLVADEVAVALEDVIAVRINGDAGPKERRLMASFDTEIFPSLFLRRTPDGEFERLDAFDGKGGLRPAAAFAADLHAEGAATASSSRP